MSITPEYRTLGKYTPTPPVQSEELRAAYQEIEKLKAELLEVREYLEDFSDVNDGDYGSPEPNRAMRLILMIDDSLNGSVKC